MPLQDIAAIAFMILWGGGLCGLGWLAFVLGVSRDTDRRVAALLIGLFALALAATYAVVSELLLLPVRF